MEGADLYCIKKGKTPQFGICVSADGYKPGQNAGAVTLSSALSDQPSFVAVFKVPNGWWYVCVRDDVILANGDMLYLSEEDAKKQFMSMLMVPDWKLKIAPPEWNIEDTLYPDLDDLLSRGSKVKLQKINTKGKMFYIIAGAGAFIVLYILYQLFMSLFDTTPTVPVMVPVAPKSRQDGGDSARTETVGESARSDHGDGQLSGQDHGLGDDYAAGLENRQSDLYHRRCQHNLDQIVRTDFNCRQSIKHFRPELFRTFDLRRRQHGHGGFKFGKHQYRNFGTDALNDGFEDQPQRILSVD